MIHIGIQCEMHIYTISYPEYAGSRTGILWARDARLFNNYIHSSDMFLLNLTNVSPNEYAKVSNEKTKEILLRFLGQFPTYLYAQ